MRRWRVARHEIDQLNRALGGIEAGGQDQRAVAVAACDTRLFPRCDLPMPMVAVAEQSRKARPGIKSWPAQPVDRPIASDQRRGDAIADEGIILQARARR